MAITISKEALEALRNSSEKCQAEIVTATAIKQAQQTAIEQAQQIHDDYLRKITMMEGMKLQPSVYQDPWTSTFPKASGQSLKVTTNSDMMLDFRRIENGFIVTKRNAKSGIVANETFCADIDAVGEYVKSQYIVALLQGEKK